MEGFDQKKRLRQGNAAAEDVAMEGDSQNLKDRKIVKAKRKQATKVEENAEDLSYEDSQSDEFEEEDVVQRDEKEDGDGWEDCSDEEMTDSKAVDKKAKTEAPKVWDDQKEPLKEDEELEYDGSAYQMLHRS
jgi:hypothetical protein